MSLYLKFLVTIALVNHGSILSRSGAIAKFATASLIESVPLRWGSPSESVRDELARLQKENGLSLVLVDQTIEVMILAGKGNSKEIKLPQGGTDGELSTDGTEVAFIISRGVGSHLVISRTGGTDLKEYPDVEPEPQHMCWSHDKSMLVLQARIVQEGSNLESTLAAHERQPTPTLQILDLRSGKPREINRQGTVTSQCWSRDDKQLVYEISGEIRVFDVETNRSQAVSTGRSPTWSPDGNNISFVRNDGYYSVSSSGNEQRRLFKKFQPVSGLFWSPDSQFVAFISEGRFLECGFALDVETYCLRIRRMTDNEEWRVLPANAYSLCQWVVSKELLSTIVKN